MITDLILKAICFPIFAVFDMAQNIQFTIPVGVFNGLSVLAKDLGYIFPVSAIAPIIAIRIGLRIFSIFWTIVLKIKSFIPTMGD